MRRTPTGFIGKCQCGAVVGALDFDRSDRKGTARMLGDWLFNGWTVEPRFGENWSVKMTPCKCVVVRAPGDTSQREEPDD